MAISGSAAKIIAVGSGEIMSFSQPLKIPEQAAGLCEVLFAQENVKPSAGHFFIIKTNPVTGIRGWRRAEESVIAGAVGSES